MKNEKIKALAKEVFSIDWARSQSDCIHENDKIREILFSLESLSKDEGLRLMMKVLEAKELSLKYDKEESSPFRDMKDFEYLSLDIWSTIYQRINKEFKVRIITLNLSTKGWVSIMPLITIEDGDTFIKISVKNFHDLIGFEGGIFLSGLANDSEKEFIKLYYDYGRGVK